MHQKENNGKDTARSPLLDFLRNWHPNEGPNPIHRDGSHVTVKSGKPLAKDFSPSGFTTNK